MTIAKGKMNLDGSFVMENQDADSKLRFGFTDPSLARCIFRCGQFRPGQFRVGQFRVEICGCHFKFFSGLFWLKY